MSQLETTEFLCFVLFLFFRLICSKDLQRVAESPPLCHTAMQLLPLNNVHIRPRITFHGFSHLSTRTQARAARGDRDAPAWPVWVSQINTFFFFLFFFPRLSKHFNCVLCVFSLFTLLFLLPFSLLLSLGSMSAAHGFI